MLSKVEVLPCFFLKVEWEQWLPFLSPPGKKAWRFVVPSLFVAMDSRRDCKIKNLGKY